MRVASRGSWLGLAGHSPTLSDPGACLAAGVSSGRTDVDTTPTFLSRPQPTGFASSRPGLSGASKPGKKGMQLGKAKKTNDFLDSLRAEVSTMQLFHTLCDPDKFQLQNAQRAAEVAHQGAR